MTKTNSLENCISILVGLAVLVSGCSRPSLTSGPHVGDRVQSVARPVQADQQAAVLGSIALTQDPIYCAKFRDNPQASARDLARKFSSYEGNLRSESAKVYAQVFTAKELDALSQFYATAEGRSITAKLPQLYGALSAIGAPYVRAAAIGGDPVPFIACDDSTIPDPSALSR